MISKTPRVVKDALLPMADDPLPQSNREVSRQYYLKALTSLLINDAVYLPSSIILHPGMWNSRAPSNIADGLSPTVLRVCTQIYAEAYPILYQKNTLFALCSKNDNRIFSPLNRSLGQTNDGSWASDSSVFHFANSFTAFTSSKNFPLVKQWNLVVEAKHGDNTSPSLALFSFCKALSSSDTRKLRVTFDVSDSTVAHPQATGAISRETIQSQLSPLTMLRNIQTFELLQDSRAAEEQTVVQPRAQQENFLDAVKEHLEFMVRGSTSPVRVYEMYEKLLAYAQAFERNEEFRSEMRSGLGEERNRILSSSPSTREGGTHPPAISLDNILPDIWATLDMIKNLEDIPRSGFTKFRSPFKAISYHPVEEGLAQASIALEMNAYDAFKAARKQVLEYLEPQYGRIVSTSLSISEWAKKNKNPGEIMSSTYWGEPDFSEILSLLAVYARSFKRDVPDQDAIDGRLFNLVYSFQERERLFTEIEYLAEQVSSEDFSDLTPKLINAIKKVVDNVDAQMLETRKARKLLFSCDPLEDDNDLGCDINPEAWRSEGFIEWDVLEPEIGCEQENENEGWGYLRRYPSLW